jgi:hypothetical protein
MRLSPTVILTSCLIASTSFFGLSFGAERSTAAPNVMQPNTLASASGARLISETQFRNTIAGMFGPDFIQTESFAPVRREKGLVAVGSSTAVVTSGAFDRLENMARKISAKAVEPEYRDLVLGCRPADITAPDPVCAQQVITQAGRLLFRRPLKQDEIETHTAIANSTATALKDFYAGVSDALVSLMIAPDALFIKETTKRNADGKTVLTGISKATRLSVLLWDAYPDDELLTAAADGSLDTARGLQRQVDRMLASPRLAGSVRAFFTDMLQFDKFATLSKDAQIYPAFTGKVATDTKEQSLRLLVDHLVTNNLDYRDLFTTRKTFLTNDLGMIYRIPVEKPNGWVEYTFPEDSPRSGFLTNISLLSLYSHPGRSSPTKRGRAMRELLLCQQVPDPPANVDFAGFEDPTSPAKTVREKLSLHATNPVCAGCHKITDPIGLGLENFDGAGQYRTEDDGEKIDASGVLSGVAFKDPKSLGQALRNDPAVPTCLVNRVSAFALGRAMTNADSQWMKYLQEDFAANGYQIRPLLKRIATSDAFYTVQAAPSEQKRASIEGSK